ncbi:MAG: hypothetical protein HON14_02575 [Rhodospirillaceae bacterium]|jgi:hypothetical protein|nr:hypothetical protein [Rhodospirillaceae bacterium]MBT4937989.1 hypothetical protein [Rhodospirillaceae bacterium]MBT5938352.1 hypothetical protein [Rhodospirillaceae bacterium]MBT7268260.1 hypothetical protein [Rhodospirillaceae bacterium]
MAIEIRRILLEQHEVQAVLNVYAKLEENNFPIGFVVGFEIKEEVPLTLFVSVQLPNGEQVGVEMDEESLVDAMIHFCIATKVPVSRKSKKTMKLKDDKLSFDMSLINPSFSTNI